MNKSIIWALSKKPKIFWAFSKDNSSSCKVDNIPLSNKDNASLTDPSEILTISFKALSVTFPFSFKDIFFKKSKRSDDFILDKSNL